MQVATSIHCPAHDKLEWAELETRTGAAHAECGVGVVYLTDAEMADILLD